VEEFLSILFQGLVEIVFTFTGHAVLWCVTLGRWKMTNGRDLSALIIGILIWISMIIIGISITIIC
jgi:hypothetical protein